VSFLLVGCLPAGKPGPLPDLEGLSLDAKTQIEEVHAAAMANPGAEAIGRLGSILLAYDFPTHAVYAFESAIAMGGDASDWGYCLGVLHRQQGDLAAASDRFATFSRQHPTDGLAELRLGEVRLEQGDFSGASRRFEAVLKRDSTIALAHFLWGQAMMEASQFAEAVSHFQSALVLQPGASQIRSPLASALRGLEEQRKESDICNSEGIDPSPFAISEWFVSIRSDSRWGHGHDAR